jgi:hypothetical protein
LAGLVVKREKADYPPFFVPAGKVKIIVGLWFFIGLMDVDLS